jgi:ribosome-associated translation inhibitor RaiA
MRINLHASGFGLTNHTRDFVQSTLLYRCSQFRDRIGSVEVNLSDEQRSKPARRTACEIVVKIEPFGQIRRRAEHEWLHVAIDRAASAVGAEVERAMLQVRPTVSSPPAIRGRHDDGLEMLLDENRISHQQREMLERPENYLRSVRVRERWRPTPTEERGEPRVRRNAIHGRSKPSRRRSSRSISRIY